MFFADRRRPQGGSLPSRLIGGCWLAMAHVASFFTRKSHAALGEAFNNMILKDS
jgi:hypothetical protein